MSEKTSKQANTSNFFVDWVKNLSGVKTYIELADSVYDFQVKNAQTINGHLMGYVKNSTDHMVKNYTEGVKMAQDNIGFAFGLIEEWNKTAFEAVEKVRPSKL